MYMELALLALLTFAYGLMSERISKLPMSGPIVVFALMNNDSIGYPVGGSLPISRIVEKQAVSLGAKFEYRAEVARIIVEGGAAQGMSSTHGSSRARAREA